MPRPLECILEPAYHERSFSLVNTPSRAIGLRKRVKGERLLPSIYPLCSVPVIRTLRRRGR